jgi:hypothetical protein
MELASGEILFMSKRSDMGGKRSSLKSTLIKKGLRIAGLGIAVWGLTLFWPEINRFLNDEMIIKIVLGLGGVILIYVLRQHLGWPHDHHRTGQDHSSSATSNNLSPSVSNEGGWR